ncbi:MAG: TetR/AcrR family transcriptional regulator [Tenericutes bacterium]|nr:TetR/AcrR family transcriptional regulator [Mycoplasmatota bacterium]
MLTSDKTYLLKKNEALFEATLNEFSSKPYDLASTNIIIKNSDYNKGSFYYRFKTKEEIYYALIDYVYTLGVVSLNTENITLQNISKPEDVVDLLFQNIKNIWDLDNRYYNLLKMINNESKYLKEEIELNCIESSERRIKNRLLDILKQRNYPYIDIFMNSLNSLLYQHFKGFNHLDTELIDIKKFLFDSNGSINLEQQPKKTELSGLHGNLNYIVTDKLEVYLAENDTFRLSGQLINKQNTLAAIRNKLKIKQITLENIIDAGMKKSLRDLSFFISLKSLKFAKTSYHALEYSQQIALLLVYNSFIAKEYIVLDQLISNYLPEELEILFNLILPKTAKISKIVVIDKTIYPQYIDNFYTYVSNNDVLREIKTSSLMKETDNFLVNYYEDDLLKTKILHKDDEQLLFYLKNKKIKNISSDYSLECKDIEECKG